MGREPSKIKSDILLRVRLLYVLFIFVGAVVLLRLIWVQQFSREVATNAARLSNRIFTDEILPAQRGSILSRDGEPLAISIFRYKVLFDFASEGLRLDEKTYSEQSDSLAGLLSAYFHDRSAAEYARLFREEYRRERDNYRLTNTRDTLLTNPALAEMTFLGRIWARFRGEAKLKKTIHDTIRAHKPIAFFPREVDYAEWETLSRYPLLNRNMGFVYRLERRDERIYPQGGLARRTIGDRGYYGKANARGDTLFGNYGIEDSYRTELSGRDGRTKRQRIARGFSGRVAGAGHEDPVDGMDVVTTLDADLQDVADKALRRQMERQNATWGTTIVMETRTGEILALANLGRNADGSYSERDNYALKQTMDPGSTFKLASMLVLLDDAKMSPETIYDTNNGDPVTVGPAKNICDSHRGDREIDFRRAVAASSNVYFARAIWDCYGATGKKLDYSRYLREVLHLHERVGLESLGEGRPFITEDWKVPDPGVMLVKMSYGYRVEMAPIHVITFYNAIANDGRMISPILVRELRRGDRTVERFESRTIASSICSRHTLRFVHECLRAVCTEGTASAYFRDTTHVCVAAKTGTAQVTSPRKEPGMHYLGSLVAFFPADEPRYTVLTSIETRQQPGKAYYGGPLAGPVVKQVVDYIYNSSNDWCRAVDEDAPRRYPERIKGGDIAQIRRVADKFARKVDYDRRTGWGRVAVDSLSRVEISSLQQDARAVPDVRGMGLKDALFLLESRGLKVRFSGRGSVLHQSINAGTRVKPGTAITITLG